MKDEARNPIDLDTGSWYISDEQGVERGDCVNVRRLKGVILGSKSRFETKKPHFLKFVHLEYQIVALVRPGKRRFISFCLGIYSLIK